MRIFNGKQINSYPRPQLFAKAGTWNYTNKATDCAKNGHPNLKGWYGTENREYDIECIAG